MVTKSDEFTPEELAVIQSRYGVDLSAEKLEITDQRQLDEIEATALRKLRRHTLETIYRWRQAV